MKDFVLRTIKQPWFFSLELLGVGLFAYGLIIPSLGFYWDDWEGVYLHQLNNPAISFQYYNERPLSAIVYLLLFPITKLTPVVWQIVALLLRWGGILFIYFTLNLVWPSRQRQNRWVAALLFVFPGFLEQPVSVAFAQHLITYLFFAVSLYLTILAIKRPGQFWVWMPLSVLLGGLQIFMMEYFVGLEIIRPLLIWFALQSIEKKKGSLWKALLMWVPFALILAAYLYWRLVYLPPTLGVDPNAPALLETILSNPPAGFVSLISMIYKDALQLMLYVWPKALFDPEIMNIQTLRVWLAWFIGAFTCITFSLYNLRTRQDEPDGNSQSTWQLILLGTVIFLFGTAPVWAKGEQIAVGKWSERYALAPMLGAILLIVTLIEWLVRTHRQKQVLLTLLLGISVSGQMFNQVLFRDDWKTQTEIYWQLHWRIPSLKPGTALFGKGTFTDKSSYYDGTYIVNLLFDPTPRQDPRYAYFDIFHAHLDDYLPGIPLTQRIRSGQFAGNTSQAVAFDFGVRGGCVRVLDSIYKDDSDLSSSIADMVKISDVTNITLTPGPVPNPDILGAEPAHTWCYYFEKADLARQMQDWKTILQIKATADSFGYEPDLAAEYLPFIEAYAQTSQWEQAYLLSLTAHETGKGSGMALCNAWQRFTQFTSSPDMLSYTAKAIQAFCPAGNP